MTASNDAEGYTTDPTNVTAANSGGGSGTAFSLVSPSNTTAIQATAAAAIFGTRGYIFTTTSAAICTTQLSDGAGATSFFARLYLNYAAMPSATMSGPMHLRSTVDGNMCRLDLTSTGTVIIQATGTATTSTGMTANNDWLVEWYGTGLGTTTGTQTVDVYAAASPFSLYSTATVSGTANTTGTTDRCRFVKTNTSTGTWGPIKADKMDFQPGSTTRIAPVTNGTLFGRRFIVPGYAAIHAANR